METISNTSLFIITIVCCVNSFLLDHSIHVDLIPAKTTSYSLPPGNITEFTVKNLTQSVTYVTFQIHTQYHNISVSSTANFLQNSTVSGSQVGFVSRLKVNDIQATWFVRSNANKTINTVIVASTYTKYDPVPGGCNQVYTLAENPNLHLSYSKYWTDVTFPLASDGAARGFEPKDCDMTHLDYDLYVAYVKEYDLSEELFMSTMKTMLTVSDIMENGRKVSSFNSKNHQKPYFTIRSVAGQGAVYAVLVGQVNVSSYVSTATYSCDIQKRDECQAKDSVFDIIIVLFCGAAGLFLCFVGHRFFKTELFILGFVAFFLIFYIIMVTYSDMMDAVMLGISVVLGIVGGLLYFLLWFFVGFPVISVLFGSLVAGYVFSSVLFFTPFGNLSYWQTNFNYGMTFTCGVLIVPGILICFTKTLNILTCTFVGSYGVVVCIDYFLHSSLKYIILNSIRHSTVPGYLSVLVVTPFEVNDIILSCVWVILFVVGSVFQFSQHKGRAPFPPCPYKKMFKRPRQELSSPQLISHSALRPEDQRSEERQTLLSNEPDIHSTDYQSISPSGINRPA
ncbi:transmembrane 7 superfamily member 3-like [Gigantopelta aegis]|uniref:transmembrane 7 superfamily member 3-like n=1 Tax=Gigantopelta aegis TaxID=1735272 RepID=UPI001B88C6BF|nr:transmembrane 7 superfamily member 3-like [Gigantopelta aegis]